MHMDSTQANIGRAIKKLDSIRKFLSEGTGNTRIDQDAFVLASAMLGYQVDKNIKLQLNVDNIFDKKYYEGIGANSMNWGTPRNATLSVRYNF